MASLAAQSQLFHKGPKVGPYFLWSLLVHAAVLGLGIGYARYFAKPPMDLDQKPLQVHLARLGTPREEKLLPRKEEPPPPPVKTEQAPAPEPVKPPDRPQIAVPIKDLKPLEAKTEKKAGEKTGQDRKKLFSAFDRLSKSTKPEEMDGQLNGDARGDSSQDEGDRYWGLLQSQVKQHYNVSDAIPEQERIRLRANVMMRLDRTGAVMHVQLVKSSGNALFDSAVLQAVKKASPFSPPPDRLRDLVSRRGVSLEFTPN